SRPATSISGAAPSVSRSAGNISDRSVVGTFVSSRCARGERPIDSNDPGALGLQPPALLPAIPVNLERDAAVERKIRSAAIAGEQREQPRQIRHVRGEQDAARLANQAIADPLR